MDQNVESTTSRDEMSQETRDGLEMAGLIPVIALEKPQKVILQDPNGGYHEAETPAWIKFSAMFRESMLAKLKGAKLSVFMCICLHINENGESFPSQETMARETGYDRSTVSMAVQELNDLGIMDLVSGKQSGTHNVYRPYYAAYGKSNPLVPGGVGKSNTLSGGVAYIQQGGVVWTSH